MKTALPPAPRTVVLRNVSWQTYQALLADLGDHRGRITYDQGMLEIMSPYLRHEALKKLIGRLLETLTLELNIPIKSAGSTTLQREDLKRGAEPDECYYIGNEASMRGKLHLDLAHDPPPDLAVEIDISRSSLNRLEIYAALGIPEVWRYDGENLLVYELKESGYATCEKSALFPALPIGELPRFLGMQDSVDETSLVRAFRDWLRPHFGLES